MLVKMGFNRLLISATTVFVVNAAYAQQQPSPTAPSQTFNLSVSLEDINLIGEALSDKPFGKVAPLINKLQGQIIQQQQQAQIQKPQVAPIAPVTSAAPATPVAPAEPTK